MLSFAERDYQLLQVAAFKKKQLAELHEGMEGNKHANTIKQVTVNESENDRSTLAFTRNNLNILVQQR